ncbi:MAG TPA: radical SAM protein [Longimicrobiales bacterium]
MPTPTDLMRQSPHDTAAGRRSDLVQLTINRPRPREWAPSRFNARARSSDGSLVLWNTYTGAITAFKSSDAPLVERLLSQRGFTGELSGLTKYLHDRGFIVPKDSDEYRRFQLTFGEQHYRTNTLQLILLASEDCNFRCTYCYERFARGTMLPEVRQGVKNLIAKRAPGLASLQISWFGGEPLYGWNAIEDLAPFCLDIARQHSITYRSSMTTNGYLLTPDVAEKLIQWEVRSFQITLDGLAEDHDRKRKGRDGRGTFDVILSNLKALQRRKDEYSVSLRVNFDRDNYPNLERFLDVLRDDFAGDDRFRLSLHAVGKWGGPNDSALDVCGRDEAQEVRERVHSAAVERGLSVRRGGVKDINRPGKSVCYAARPFNFIVGADGKLMKCTVALDTKDYNIVGRLSPDGEMELDLDKLALWVQPAFENDTTCRACYFVPVCQGMRCPLIRIEDKRRPCPPTKHHLKSELLSTLALHKERGRQLVIRGERQ